MLDDKLREIRVWSGVDDQEDIFDTLSDSAIDEIKQAFADAGYVSPEKAFLLQSPKVGGFLSGQEWYDRFKKEYRALSPKAYAKDFYAKKAAQKAAGLVEPS